jgi:predicted transcriptional regulator
MHIDLPDELVSRLRQRAASAPGASEADVIREALNSLDWQDAERAAIQEGLDAIKAGRVRPFEEFDREFRVRIGLSGDG